MGKLNLIVREIKNYFFLRKVLNRESKNPTSEWNKFGLRKNWYGRIYTVLSLREEDMGEEDMVRNWKAMEMMRPINAYLASLDIQEIIFPSIEPVANTRSYLVVYSPIFNVLTVSWVMWRILFLVGIVVPAICIAIHLI